MESNEEGKQNIGAVIGLVAVILIAGTFIVRQIASTRQRYTPPDGDWVCEQCGHEFIAPVRWEIRDCPSRGCAGEAVRVYFYYDIENEELIEVYRAKPVSDHPEDRMVKAPGGEWERTDYGMEADYGFPVKVDNPENLRYAPPGSDYR